MLVLTRKVDQTIQIDGDIIIHILRVERDRVKLGIEAPKDKVILRGELIINDRHRPAGSRMEEVPYAHPEVESRTSDRSQDTSC